MPRARRILPFFSFFFLTAVFLFPFSGAQAIEESPPQEIVFSFLEALPRTQVTWEDEMGRRVGGEWEGERFRFQGLPGLADIFPTDAAAVEGKSRLAIWIQPFNNLQGTLAFSNIPPGRRLRFFFALPDVVLQQTKIIPVYLEVWLGRKKLFETRVNTKGWQEKTIDLTLPFLLQRRFLIRLKVWVPEAQSSALLFYGRIE